jgi:hypothetical protein
MQNPLNLGNKIIDAANVHAIKPLSEERTAGLVAGVERASQFWRRVGAFLARQGPAALRGLPPCWASAKASSGNG